jgi:hypothetical protein
MSRSSVTAFPLYWITLPCKTARQNFVLVEDSTKSTTAHAKARLVVLSRSATQHIGRAPFPRMALHEDVLLVCMCSFLKGPQMLGFQFVSRTSCRFCRNIAYGIAACAVGFAVNFVLDRSLRHFFSIRAYREGTTQPLLITPTLDSAQEPYHSMESTQRHPGQDLRLVSTQTVWRTQHRHNFISTFAGGERSPRISTPKPNQLGHSEKLMSSSSSGLTRKSP